MRRRDPSRAVVIALCACLACAALLVGGCAPPRAGDSGFAQAAVDASRVTTDHIPYYGTDRVKDVSRRAFDASGAVLVQDRRDKNIYYRNAVTICQLGLTELNNHRLDGSAEHLDRARAQADALIAMGVTRRDALFFPYARDNEMADDVVLEAPWYSGMAQGQAVGFLSRMWEATGDERYDEASRAVLRSLDPTGPGGSGAYRVTDIDETGHLWFEEAPTDPESHILNGHVFAVFGLYDYCRLHPEDERALELLRGGVATVRDRAVEFRDPGKLSAYCLRWRNTNPHYHEVHITQLRELEALTGDATFGRLAEEFESDTPSETPEP